MEQLSRLNTEMDSKRRPLDEASRLLMEVESPYQEMEKEIGSCQQTALVAQETSARFESHLNRLSDEEERNQARKQIEEAKRAYDILQEQVRQRREKQLEIRGELEILRQQHEEANSNFERHTKGMTETRKKLEKSISEAQKVLETEIVTLDGNLRSCYERLVLIGKRPAAISVDRTFCGGCHMEIPPREYNRLISNNGELNLCSHCSRIIFIATPENTDQEKEPSKKSASKKDSKPKVAKVPKKPKVAKKTS